MKKLYLKNREGLEEFNIPYNSWMCRKPGLSAMMRLGNEEEFIRPCIESIIDWFDEIVCTLQNSTDKTEEILRSFGSDKIKIYHYPFDSVPNGPGHDEQPRGSVHERAYFYNWSLSKTRYQWVSKWDGDMVAMDGFGEWVHELIAERRHEVICCAGINIVKDLKHKSSVKPWTANEPRFFQVYPGVFYFTGRMCEDIHHPSFKNGAGFGEKFDVTPGDRVHRMGRHGYLHFKHAKTDAAATMAWPQKWKSMPHFQKIYEYGQPGEKYKGEVPKALRGVM